MGVLHQSIQRVSSSSEQFGAVQQEGRVATAIEIVLLHVDNLKRSYEKEHNELEDARRILIEHKLLVDESHYVRPSTGVARNRSISVVQPSAYTEVKPRRASLGLGPGPGGQKHLEVGAGEAGARPRSPAAGRKVNTSGACWPLILTTLTRIVNWATQSQSIDKLYLQVSQNSSLTTVKEDFDKSSSNLSEKKSAVFSPIAESGEEGIEGGEQSAKSDDNNNNGAENMNKNIVNGASVLAAARRKESRKTSHFDIDTIMEEIDDLAVKRDSSPNKQQAKPLPKTPTELMQRKK